MKRLLTSLALIVALVTPLLTVSTVPAYAQGKKDACEAIGGTLDAAGTCVSNDPNDKKGVTDVIKTVIEILSFIVGALAIIMIIVGGIRYVTSGGDANSISAAKNTILYAIVGLVIAVLAEAMVRFVFTKATK